MSSIDLTNDLDLSSDLSELDSDLGVELNVEQDTYLEELRKLLGFQYYFLNRTFGRTGELPAQSMHNNLSEVDQLLEQIFSEGLDETRRAGAIYSLKVFFISIQGLLAELEEFPRFDDAWERYESLIMAEAGEEFESSELDDASETDEDDDAEFVDSEDEEFEGEFDGELAAS